jgi:hypothetical protein
MNEARKPLYEYLRASGGDDRTYVFPSQRSERFTKIGTPAIQTTVRFRK